MVETLLVRRWWMAKPSPPGFFFFFFFFFFSFSFLFFIFLFFLIFTVAIGVEQLSPLLIFFLVAIGVEQLSLLLINHKTRWLTIRWKRVFLKVETDKKGGENGLLKILRVSL